MWIHTKYVILSITVVNALAQLAEALRYKTEVRGFDSR
jgi:hypothetical protein